MGGYGYCHVERNNKYLRLLTDNSVLDHHNSTGSKVTLYWFIANSTGFEVTLIILHHLTITGS